MGAALSMRALPKIRGRYTQDAPLGARSWFRAGGSADILFEPADEGDLAHFLKHCPAEIPRIVIGAGSNILVRDGGVRGIVIRLGRAFGAIRQEGATIRAGAAARCAELSRHAFRASLSGFAFMQGIPGTVGGALRMNAGAYGGDIARICRGARAMGASGEARCVKAEKIGFSYRRSAIDDQAIFLEGVFAAEKGDPQALAKEMAALQENRATSQPPGARTGGSTFKNPHGVSADGPKAWRLIRDAGADSLSRGGARVSSVHCNFLVNEGGATAADIEALGEEMRRRVKDHSGISLEWEIRIIGERQ